MAVGTLRRTTSLKGGVTQQLQQAAKKEFDNLTANPSVRQYIWGRLKNEFTDFENPDSAINWVDILGQCKKIIKDSNKQPKALPQSLVPSPLIDAHLQSLESGSQPFGSLDGGLQSFGSLQGFGSLQSVDPYSFNAEGQYPSFNAEGQYPSFNAEGLYPSFNNLSLQELEEQPNTPTPTTPTTPVLLVHDKPKGSKTLLRTFSGQQPLTDFDGLFSPKSANRAKDFSTKGGAVYRANPVPKGVVQTLKNPKNPIETVKFNKRR